MPSNADISLAVETIIASGMLGQSERRARLLKYLVRYESDGRGEEIKAFSIALDVFGRDETFDPNSDSIVRSEVGRLRDALRLFYAENTDPSLVVIDIPKGTYRPIISAPSHDQKPRATQIPIWIWFLVAGLFAVVGFLVWGLVSPAPKTISAEQSGTPYKVVRIAVMPFESSGDHPELEEIAFGLYSELAMDLSAYPWIAVVAPLVRPLNPDNSNVDYVLRNSILWQGDQLLSNSQLISLPDQRLIWSKSQSTETTVEAIRSTQNSITSEIVNSLGAHNGISPDLVISKNARVPKSNLEAFVCFINIYSYSSSPSDEEHLELRICLERVVRNFPDFGEAWAALGVIYMDEVRAGRNPRPGSDPWADAKTAIDQGLLLSPLRNPTLMAALINAIEAPDRDLTGATEHSEKLIQLFPRHPLTLVVVGAHQALFLGQWDAGLARIRHALDLQHSPTSFYFLTPAFHAMMGTDDVAVQVAVAKLTSVTSEPELLLRYLEAARLGQVEQMEKQRELMAKQHMKSDADLLNWVRSKRYHALLERALLEQLEAAFIVQKEG